MRQNRPLLERNRRLVKIKIADFVSAESKLKKNEQLTQWHSAMKASELNLERIQRAQNVINDLALCCMIRDKTAFE